MGVARMFTFASDFDFFFCTLVLWILGFIDFTQRLYRYLSSSMPWQWFQGHTKGRAVVLSIAVGLVWPVVVILKQLENVPFVMKFAESVALPRSMRRRKSDNAARK
ncbi:hypothetical protein ACFORH_42870 [Amycolatopsis roodepoortensis]|uniref:Uncharacterized protein n=1 Tax=Amycolatopsis roodepoortensis TaxID=700274 RepID=A0ABR9KYG0_9PSEU|nr:hypothetical protein [Amycolatopsis roodepoortensis]MBE1572983.1 hypothetical protein [Amycolatopsis roodepoortensis]MBE1576875.1 hypothetical protein [Amycolatopsis roodepoortensis]